MKMTLLALALPALLAAAAPAPPAPSVTLEEMVAICKLPARDAQRRLAELPDQVQAAALLVCIGYARGHDDLLRQLQGAPGQASSI